MRAISTENQAALSARALVARDFIWFVARDRETLAPVSVGFWSDIENVSSVPVIDPNTGSLVSRSYYGAGSLIAIDDIPAVSTVQVQDIRIRMSQLDAAVNNVIRFYDTKQARVEIHRGLFDPVSRDLVAPAFVRFVGFVNLVEVHTPPEGGDGYAELTCVSHTQELTRANPSTRSHADQQLRAPGDTFFVDAAVVGDWKGTWGESRGAKPVETRKGLFGWGNFLGFL